MKSSSINPNSRSYQCGRIFGYVLFYAFIGPILLPFALVYTGLTLLVLTLKTRAIQRATNRLLAHEEVPF